MNKFTKLISTTLIIGAVLFTGTGCNKKEEPIGAEMAKHLETIKAADQERYKKQGVELAVSGYVQGFYNADYKTIRQKVKTMGDYFYHGKVFDDPNNETTYIHDYESQKASIKLISYNITKEEFKPFKFKDSDEPENGSMVELTIISKQHFIESGKEKEEQVTDKLRLFLVFDRRDNLWKIASDEVQ